MYTVLSMGYMYSIGAQHDIMSTPVSSSRGRGGALMHISNMDPGSGAFGAALAAAERANSTPQFSIGRSLSQVWNHCIDGQLLSAASGGL